MSETPKRQMALSLLMIGAGNHMASWRHPDANPRAQYDIQHFVKLAEICERGRFDMLFHADTPTARNEPLDCWSRYPLFMAGFEAITLLSALAMTTKHIGLGGTVTTSFTEPYNVARQFASLDHISGGRVAWNVVTSAVKYIARNFGQDVLAPHAERYRRAVEHVEVVRSLWDTYDDDAFLHDKENGRYFDPEKFHILDYRGEFFKVYGALNVPRSPQGQPVIVQAGSSDDGQDLAARTAEVVFGNGTSIEAARAFYASLKGRMAKYDRPQDHLKILPGFSVMIGESRDEAEAKYETLQALIHPDVGRFYVAGDLEADLSGLPLDEPIPEDRIPKSANLHKAYFDIIVRMIREEKLTLRQIYMRYRRGNLLHFGTPKDIADTMQEWFETRACDGFMLNPPLALSDTEDFVNLVVPELQRRGLFRTEYTGTTLRDHLGLPYPESRYAPRREERRSA